MMIFRLPGVIVLGLALAACTSTEDVVNDCVGKFVTQRHADPAAAERTCSCLVERLPADKVVGAEGYLLTPGGMDKTFIADFAWWAQNRETAGNALQECRFLGCAGLGSVDERCEFDAAYSADARGDHAAAIRWYSKEIETHPDRPAAIGNRGRDYLDIGSYELAIADLERSVELAGAFNHAYRWLARAYSLAGRNTEALKAANLAVASYYRDPWSYRYRAEIHEALGNKSAAIADYREVIKINSFDENRQVARDALSRLGVE